MATVSDRFELETDFDLKGDQPRAIAQLCEGLVRGDAAQVLLAQLRQPFPDDAIVR